MGVIRPTLTSFLGANETGKAKLLVSVYCKMLDFSHRKPKAVFWAWVCGKHCTRTGDAKANETQSISLGPVGETSEQAGRGAPAREHGGGTQHPGHCCPWEVARGTSHLRPEGVAFQKEGAVTGWMCAGEEWPCSKPKPGYPWPGPLKPCRDPWMAFIECRWHPASFSVMCLNNFRLRSCKTRVKDFYIPFTQIPQGLFLHVVLLHHSNFSHPSTHTHTCTHVSVIMIISIIWE